MQKVFLEAFDKKRNRHMPQKWGFLTPKRNSSSLSVYHLD